MSQLTHSDARTVEIVLPKDVEAKLNEKARTAGLSLELYLRGLAVLDSDDNGVSRLDQELHWLTNRSSQDVERTRTELLKSSHTPQSLPEGKSLVDMVEGKWPGDETDDEVREALDRLS